MMNFEETQSLLDRLMSIRENARRYFGESASVVPLPERYSLRDYWKDLPEPLKEQAGRIADELATLAHGTGPAIRRSPLLTEVDEREAGHAFKGMRAALRFRRFLHSEPQVVHDEGTVLGVQPATKSEESTLHPEEAKEVFEQWLDSLQSRIELMSPEPGASLGLPSTTASKPIAAGYRPGTAFIMMWMAKDRPELVDVSNTVKRCFAKFGVEAVRSDDIEHEDVITQRILDEIKTAEFLFADLTGERPSVYYEVGYAHAIGRRIILFRKAGTNIHFDLAAYNCPEYQNLSELEDKLMKRLEYVTGKVPKK